MTLSSVSFELDPKEVAARAGKTFNITNKSHDHCYTRVCPYV